MNNNIQDYKQEMLKELGKILLAENFYIESWEHGMEADPVQAVSMNGLIARAGHPKQFLEVEGRTPNGFTFTVKKEW